MLNDCRGRFLSPHPLKTQPGWSVYRSMTPGDLELLAEAAYHYAKLPLTDAVSPVRLAATIFGWDAFCESRTTNDGSIVGSSVVLPANLNANARAWFTSRALSRWLLEPGANEVSVALLAACIRTPAFAFRELAEETGPDFPDLAWAFCISESSAALRFGEVMGDSLVLHAPGKLPRMRGNRRGIQPRTVRLSDDPSRFVRLL